jgi:hypothetical protein
MRRPAVALAVVALLAGCGGKQHASETPQNALLTGVQVDAKRVTFAFASRPLDVKAAYQPRAGLSECGSGARVPLKGSAYVVIHFLPAASADIQGEKVVPTYTGPRRLSGPGPVLETAKVCDFEADLGWAIGVERRLPLHVSRTGSTVTVSFG